MSVSDFDGSRVSEGFVLNDRYRLRKMIGQGSYGSVWVAEDQLKEEQVAVKIPKDASEMIRRSFQVECVGLLDVAECDLKDTKNCVQIRDSFYLYNYQKEGYFIIVMELLGSSLRDLLESHLLSYFDGLPVQLVNTWTQQLLQGVRFLHEDLNIVHMDLKPENIVLRSRKQSLTSLLNKPDVQSHIKLVDFGSIAQQGSFWESYVPQTPMYRSPEALLGYPVSSSMDMWSVGCIVYELVTGEPLFRISSKLKNESLDQQLLMQIIRLLGYPPKKFATGGFHSKNYFNKNGKLVDPKPYLRHGFSSLKSLFNDKFPHLFKHSLEHEAFIDFVSQCIKWNPQQRITADQALQHPWITKDYYKSTNRSGSKSSFIQNILISIGCAKKPPKEAISLCDSFDSLVSYSSKPYDCCDDLALRAY
eukprot:TRINITY_DN1893_c0_g1_i2.p1 TRINITY_DN1893_c0_g1~~TRINITY_DN1893_c0_g1_i2.p1  ORF type:complete len:418 (-),score=22.01 TRINITY_DN1893_c0_g1_i2:791-2044(-)